MGKGKKVTVSFWYKLIVLLGWCKGPIDALLEIRGGDRTAWSGRQEGDGIINVDKPDLYGGETAEGGIQGQFEVMMGTPDQAPNAYMTEHFGDHQPGRRGKSMILLRGPKIGAGNPYPKPLYFKLERILKGWDDDVCWYPEKARVGGEGFSIGAGTWWLTGMTPGGLWIGNDPTDMSAAVAVTRDPNVGVGSHGVNGGGYYRVNDQMAILLQAGNPGRYELIFDGLAVTGTVEPIVGDVPFAATGGAAFAVTVIDGRVFIYSSNYANFYVFDGNTYAGGPVTWIPHSMPGGLRLRSIAKVGSNLVCYARLSSSAAFYYATSYGDPINWQVASLLSGNVPNSGEKIQPLGGTTAFVVRDSYHLRTEDEGLTWYNSGSMGVDAVQYGSAACGAHNGAGVVIMSDTNATKLARSEDGGFTWASVPGVSWGATRMEFLDGRFVASAPGEDGGIWTADAEGLVWAQTPLPGGVEPGFYTALYLCPVATLGSGALGMMNPAHVIYDAITSRRENGGMGEPIGRVNDASFRAAADLFYDEGFGVCCTWYGGESAEQFIERICTVAGVTLSQSSVDGMYYLFPMREAADPGTLFTLTDNDIIEFEAEPALPPESINQMQVKWFDPMTREERITAPIQALGAIEDAGGVIAEIRQYYEIPYEELALRVAHRDLRSFSSALWRLRLTCTSRVYGLQKGMQVRVMAPLRGFADMIAVVGDVDEGTLTEQEISLVLLQDVFSLPDASFVEAQPPLAPPTIGDPINITDMVAVESPYVELAASMREADLQLVAEETGFLVVGAVQPGNGTQYQLATKAAGEEYEIYGNGDWTPSATIVEADVLLDGPPATAFTFEAGTLLDRVEVGTWCLWGGEMCRLDALDLVAGTITLGRAVGDTVPQPHAAGSTIYFIGDWYATDQREYVDTEVVTAKAQNRTGQGLIALDLAPSASTTMAGRQIRPYPPANVTVNGEYYPATGEGDVVLLWAHRDRLLQADQLIPWQGATVAKELGQVNNVRLYKDDVLVDSAPALDADTWTFTDPGPGTIRVEVETERDGFVSWQIYVHEMTWGGTSAFPVDPYFLMVSTLLSANGEDGSTRIYDAAGRYWTPVGNVQIDTAVQFNGTPTMLLDGSGDRLSAASSADFDFGAGEFCIEFVAQVVAATDQVFIGRRNGGGYTPFGIGIFAGKLQMLVSTTGSSWAATAADVDNFPTGVPQAVCLERVGDTVTLYREGLAVASATVTGSLMASSDAVIVGMWGTTLYPVNGNMGQLRITKGYARRRAPYTPDTEAFPEFGPYDEHYNSVVAHPTFSGADAATAFYDTKGAAWTAFGSAQVDTDIRRFGRPTALLDASSYIRKAGGSDFAFGTADFTIEFDLYWHGTTGVVLDDRTGSYGAGMAVYIPNGTTDLIFLANGANRITFSGLATATWYRVRLKREAGTTTMEVDGVSAGTYADTNDYQANTWTLGAAFNGTAVANISLANFRATKGVARSDVPVAAPFPVQTSNPAGDPDFNAVSSLLHCDGPHDGVVFKDTKGNPWSPLGNVKVTHAYKEFGNGALTFDGSGDSITSPASAVFGMGTGDYTFEGIARRPSDGGTHCVFDCRDGSNTNTALSLYFGAPGNLNKAAVYANINAAFAVLGVSTNLLPVDTLFHWALVRQGTTVYFYINGVLEFTGTDSRDHTSPAPMRYGDNMGAGGAAGVQGFVGQLDELRVTKGVCRYPDGTTFTPPASVHSDTQAPYEYV